MHVGISWLLMAALFAQPSDNPAADAGSAFGRQALYAFEGPSIGSHFGHAAAPAGDIDGDGWIDVAVGAPYADIARGTVWVYSGRNGLLLAEWQAPVEGAVRLGSAVASAGDIDGDGHADLIAGAPAHDIDEMADVGSAWIFSGADGSVLRSFQGNAAGDGLGASLADAGDVNADGIPDIIIGTLRGNYALLISGADGALLQRLEGQQPGDRFGIAVASAGDLDQDGHADVIVGADQAGRGPGYAQVHSGATGAVLMSFDGLEPGDNFGGSVAAAGDVDGDGIGDLVVGTGTHDDYRSRGRLGHARVFSGQDGSELAVLAWRGAFVSGIGDINADGHDDIALGTPFAGVDGSARGGLRIVSGRDGTVLLALDGPQNGQRLGISIHASTDLDGDGRPELILGADEFLTSAPSRGQVQVLSLATIQAPGSLPMGPGSSVNRALQQQDG